MINKIEVCYIKNKELVNKLYSPPCYRKGVLPEREKQVQSGNRGWESGRGSDFIEEDPAKHHFYQVNIKSHKLGIPQQYSG